MKVGTVELLVIGLDDLITIKRLIGRTKDQAALVQLEVIKRLREETRNGRGS